MGKPTAVLNKNRGRTGYRFHARDLHILMGPISGGTYVQFHVLIDGKPKQDVDDALLYLTDSSSTRGAEMVAESRTELRSFLL